MEDPNRMVCYLLKGGAHLEKSRKATMRRSHINQDPERKKESSNDQVGSMFQTQGIACVKVLKQKERFTYLRNPKKASVPGIKEGREKAEGRASRAPQALVRSLAFIPREAGIY